MSVHAQPISQEMTVLKQVFVVHKPCVAHAVVCIYESTEKFKGLEKFSADCLAKDANVRNGLVLKSETIARKL